MEKILVIVALVFLNNLNAQQIINIHTSELKDKLLIYYDLIGKQETLYEIEVFCSDDWDTPLQSITGAVGQNITPGKNKLITWHVLEERQQLKGKYAFKIKATLINHLGHTELHNFTETISGLNIKMIYVVGGKFIMGQPNPNIGGRGKSEGEQPEHEVSVSDFYIAETELTVEQFAKFIKETKYKTSNDTLGRGFVYHSGLEAMKGINWKYDSYGRLIPESDFKRPVVHVSWVDANAFCEWLSKITGKKYRLPTEAEWEYAAGGGKSLNVPGLSILGESDEFSNQRTIWSGTNNAIELDNFGWFTKNSKGKVHTVGAKKSNILGLYDMTGNVWEWCQDWYDPDYYKSNSQNNPLNMEESKYKVCRGGSWVHKEEGCRITSRNYGVPIFSCYEFGFRIVCQKDEIQKILGK